MIIFAHARSRPPKILLSAVHIICGLVVSTKRTQVIYLVFYGYYDMPREMFRAIDKGWRLPRYIAGPPNDGDAPANITTFFIFLS
jgi:hypothetical protein